MRLAATTVRNMARNRPALEFERPGKAWAKAAETLAGYVKPQLKLFDYKIPMDLLERLSSCFTSCSTRLPVNRIFLIDLFLISF